MYQAYAYAYKPAYYMYDVFKLVLFSSSNLSECLFQVLILLMQRKDTHTHYVITTG